MFFHELFDNLIIKLFIIKIYKVCNSVIKILTNDSLELIDDELKTYCYPIIWSFKDI